MNKTQTRFYSHSIVSYASREELEPLLKEAWQWALICHDKDTTDKHFHIVAVFKQNKSVAWVCKLVVSTQNTFSEGVHDMQSLISDYLIHDSYKEKHQYSMDDFEWSDKEYWNKRIKDDTLDRTSTEEFLEMLLAEDFNPIALAKIFGRDFIRYHEKYIAFRNYALAYKEYEDEQNAYRQADNNR